MQSKGNVEGRALLEAEQRESVARDKPTFRSDHASLSIHHRQLLPFLLPPSPPFILAGAALRLYTDPTDLPLF